MSRLNNDTGGTSILHSSDKICRIRTPQCWKGTFWILSSPEFHIFSTTFSGPDHEERKCLSWLVVMVNHCSWVVYLWSVYLCICLLKLCICYRKLFFWPRGESAFPGCDGESLQLGGVFMIRPVTDRICHFVTRGHGGHQAQGPSKGNGPKSSGRVFSFSRVWGEEAPKI